MTTLARTAAALAALLLAACGSSQGAPAGVASSTDAGRGAFPAAALSVVTTDGGKLAIAFRSAPYQPLIAGLESLELIVTDATTGAPVDGLSITMTPWMPSMGHGSDTTPTVTAYGEGRYVLTEVSLFMPGEWQLRTQLSGQVTDSVAPTFAVD